MEKKITDILAEWFYRLPNGYAIEPYDDSELKVLEQILKEEGIDSNAILKSIINEAPSGDQFIPGKDDLNKD